MSVCVGGGGIIILPCSLLGVAKHLVGLLYVVEYSRALFDIVRIFVRMILQGQSAVGLLQI